MSPIIFAVPLIRPSHSPSSLMGEGGTTSATALPKRVTRIGRLVFRTRSMIAKHLALNSEAEISSMTRLLYHSQFL